jgi:hypothetical protein
LTINLFFIKAQDTQTVSGRNHRQFGDKASPVFVGILKTMEKQYGEDFIKQLAAQKVRYYPITGAIDKLASGEVAILLAFVGTVEARRLTGQPVDWARFADNTYFHQFDLIGIEANAPHPNAPDFG